MARYVFVADERPDWQLAERLVAALDHDSLLVAGEAYETEDPAAVRSALLDGLARLRSEWNSHFFIDGGVVTADTTELDRFATALADLDIAGTAGLTVNATVRWRRRLSGRRTPADASPRTP
jgi:hypothetical protein